MQKQKFSREVLETFFAGTAEYIELAPDSVPCDIITTIVSLGYEEYSVNSNG